MERVTHKNGNRYYIHESGEKYPSVTTIISAAGVSRALMAWSAKVAAEYAVDFAGVWRDFDRDAAVDLIKKAPFTESRSAAKIGTDAHAYAEQRLRGMLAPAAGADAILAGGGDHACENVDILLAAHEPLPIAVEATVWNEELKYAGTLDCIVRVGGELILADWKTSTGVYPEMAIQLAAYRNATHIEVDGATREMVDVDACGVFHIPKKGKPKLARLRCGDDEMRAFNAFRQIYDWRALHSKSVVS